MKQIRSRNGKILLFIIAALLLTLIVAGLANWSPTQFIPSAPITRAASCAETSVPATHIPSVTASPFASETPTEAPTLTATATATRAFPTFSPTPTFTVTHTPTPFQSPTDFPTLSPSVTPIHLATETPPPLPSTGAPREVLDTVLLYPLLLMVLAGALLLVGGILLVRKGEETR